MKKECVLVSGGAGYIGSHTTVELINAGYDVVIADNFSNSDMGAVEGVRCITGVDVPVVEVDCCDKSAFRRVFEQYEFDSVIHFAASKAVGESVAEPLKYYGNNLTSFMNVVSLMHEFGRHNIVFTRKSADFDANAVGIIGRLTGKKHNFYSCLRLKCAEASGATVPPRERRPQAHWYTKMIVLLSGAMLRSRRKKTTEGFSLG